MSEKTNEDPIISAIGEFGKFQWLTCFLHALATFAFVWQIFANKFLASKVEFTCTESNINTASIANFTVEDGRCFQRQKLEVVPCEELDFSDATYRNTILERFDLACDENSEHLLRLAQTMFFVGTTIGAFACGPLSDKFGRNLILVLTLALTGASSILELFAPNFAVWTLGRFLAGACAMASNISANVYRTEVFGGKWRALGNAIGSSIPAQLAHMLMALFIYLVPDLTWLEVAMVTLAFTACVPCFFFLPESPRWLLIKKKEEKALKSIKRISKMNKLYHEGLSDKILKSANGDENPKQPAKPGIKKIVTEYPALRRNLLVCSLVWYAFSIGYYGMIYNTPPLGFSPQLVFAFPAFFMLPIMIISPFLENRIGRKPMLLIALSIGGVSGILTLAVPYDVTWAIIALCTTSAVFSFETLNISHTYTKEIFPTVMRGTAFGLCTTFARMGSISAPLFMYLTPASTPEDSILNNLPLAAYGLCMILAAVASLWLWPETAKMVVPDSLDEGEAAAATTNPWVSWCSCKGSEDKVEREAKDANEMDAMLPM